ncbi:MAG TPA: hypothetical protein VGG38_06045 [Acidimicrobiales bacterium]
MEDRIVEADPIRQIPCSEGWPVQAFSPATPLAESETRTSGDEAIRAPQTELDDTPVGFSTCDQIHFDAEAHMHLHIVDPERRAAGLGTQLVHLTAVHYCGLPACTASPMLTRRLVRPRVKTIHERDEGLQARCLLDRLELLDSVGVDGAFVYTFTAPLFSHDDDPKHDLDTDSFSLVKSCPGRRRGTAYPPRALRTTNRRSPLAGPRRRAGRCFAQSADRHPPPSRT